MEGDIPKPVNAIPALLTTISIPSGCLSFRNVAKSVMLCGFEISSPWYSIVAKPPSAASAFAFFNCASFCSALIASSPRVRSRAVR